jgi:hypothetical protein
MADDSSSRCGWNSDFMTFRESAPQYVTDKLKSFLPDAGESQVRAWRDSIPPLQREIAELINAIPRAAHYDTILEYELPMESRRPDVIFLTDAAVVVLELKGKTLPSQADIDQVEAYARDLMCYHRCCAETRVIPVLVPTRYRGETTLSSSVRIMGPAEIDAFLREMRDDGAPRRVTAAEFLRPEAYRPLPTLVAAARELFHQGDIRPIHRARAATDPAVAHIDAIVHEAARTKTRHLVLLTGVPGAGKTLVGLRVVHAKYLDDLAIDRGDGVPTAPAVYLSGNGPLVNVLQYEFRNAGGGGKTFVRGVQDFVKAYSRPTRPIPPQHVLVFDEAQRAWDPEQVAAKHRKSAATAKSEPEHFIEFAERIPEWSVVVGLVGGGQEIHVGEEAGTGQWLEAIAKSPLRDQWTVHAPNGLQSLFGQGTVSHRIADVLNLDQELRFHQATDLHRFVEILLANGPVDEARALSERLARDGYHLRISRELDVAKAYLRERYAENMEARFGLIASSRDRDLERFGVRNGYQDTKLLKFGPWYSDPEDHPDGRSCRALRDCVTEFGAQGLELDAALVAWGTDYEFRDGAWSNANARGYREKGRVRSAEQLRMNSYRVMLTRGRDATVVFVPEIGRLDETFRRMVDAGFTRLDVARASAR